MDKPGSSKVVLGVGASHSTLMNTDWDKVEHLDRAEAYRDALTDARGLIAAAKPDTVVIIGPNHFRGFWLDLLPAFTIGVGECFASGESGTPKGPQPVDTELALHVCRSVIDGGFDPAFSTKLQIDHGISHAIQYLAAGVPLVPMVVNMFAPPLPTLGRCQDLGEAIGRAIHSFPGRRRVVMIGSGGLSHALPWPKWDAPVTDDDRFMVEAWTHGRETWATYDSRRRQIIREATSHVESGFDHDFLRRFEIGRLSEYADWSTERIEEEGGNGAQEIRSWVMMAAASGGTAGKVLSYQPIPEWLTGMAVGFIEPEVS